MSAQNLGLELPLRLSGTGFVLDANGHIVGDGVYGKGAEGIVLACNSHAELVAALEAIANYSPGSSVQPALIARAALSRAKG